MKFKNIFIRWKTGIFKILTFALCLNTNGPLLADSLKDSIASFVKACAGGSLVPDLHSWPPAHFKIDEATIAKARPQLNQSFLDETLFIIPKNDGEALRAVEILKAAGAKQLQISWQGWGAVLSKESIDPKALEKVKRVVIFEMPGIKEEEELVRKGKEVVTIDHHSYRDVDRRRPESALEQLCTLIGWPMSEVDLAIAVNDRSYVYGLKKMGLTTDQIEEIRKYDLVAQGRSPNWVDDEVKWARREIPKLRRIGSVYVVESSVDSGIMKQEIAIIQPAGIANILELNGGKMGFSGSPAIVHWLLGLDMTQFGYPEKSYAQYGGGDPNDAMFFGFKPNSAPRASSEKISPEFLRQLEEKLRAIDDPAVPVEAPQ